MDGTLTAILALTECLDWIGFTMHRMDFVFLVYSVVCYNSQLPLNGHLAKTDTSLKRTRGVGPCRTSVIYFISLQGGQLSAKADSRSVSTLEGVYGPPLQN